MVTAQIPLTLSHIFSIFSLALPYALHTHRPSNLHNSLANNKYLNSALKNRAITKISYYPRHGLPPQLSNAIYSH